ncbi:hypothetical protein C1645_881328 [Glomus cerebriforme]|uniref:HCP-like protein n=1 Tax=Glomus cerebriforme TaxID=658196 RepID=A0A397S8V4_9GLOM|nr:hypothetical protein C1645_881328 [Glomus cerebriforme]
MSNENYDDNTHIYKDSENSIFSPNSNIVKCESSSLTTFIKELLQELYIILLNTMDIPQYDKLSKTINNFLLDYDLDPKDVFEIMTSSSQNIFCYSSLIGYFFQHGIGCEVNKAKALEIFSDAIKYIQKEETNQLSFDQKNEAIIFCDDTKKLNEIILQYFYSLFLYRDIISNRRDNYKLHIKNAEKGDIISQYYIANCYYFGVNIKHDYNKAFEWYAKSSKGGNMKAMYMLGTCYYYGYGGKKNKKQAFEYYLKSAEKGYKYAISKVGDCYHDGKGIFRDESKAFEWYLKTAKKGHAYNQYLVANYYYNGVHISKNEEKGFYWNRKAAINGNTDAQYRLAEYYLNNPIYKNENKAFKWYLKLVNKSYINLKAVYLVAKCYRDGIGTDKNLKEATKWIEKYISSKPSIKPPIILYDFLNGSNIDVNLFMDRIYYKNLHFVT